MNDENDSNRNSSLKNLLGDLRKTSLIFKDTLLTFGGPIELKKLNKTLSDKYGKAPELKIDVQALVDLTATWNRIKGDNRYESLTRRELIILCSIPDAIKEKEFLELLEAWKDKIPYRALPVLLATIHETWESNPNQKALGYFFSKFLKVYKGNRSYLQTWGKNGNMYLSQEGIKEFSRLLSMKHYDIPTLCAKYHLPSSSSTFVNLIRQQAIANLIKELRKTSQYDYAIWAYIFEDLIHPTDFSHLSELILVADRYSNKDAEEFLKQWFLNPDHFGDPRIYPGNWELKISKEAKEKFIQWLSKEDLEFFFKLLLKKGEDDHGRRSFWEQYLCRVVTSRVLISHEDWTTNRLILQEMRKENKTLPARIEDNTSAFIMQTQDKVIIEFSEKGNACYIWDRQNLPKSLEYDLNRIYEKNRIFARQCMINSKLPTITASNYRLGESSVRIPHPSGWQYGAKAWLDSEGIKPC